MWTNRLSSNFRLIFSLLTNSQKKGEVVLEKFDIHHVEDHRNVENLKIYRRVTNWIN